MLHAKAAGQKASGGARLRGEDQSGKLLSAARASDDTLGALLTQNLPVNLPVLLLAAVLLLVMKGQFVQTTGLILPQGRSRMSAGIALGVYAVLLVVALLLRKGTVPAIVYQWLGYLVFVALAEELVFRAVLLWMMERSGLTARCVWAIPAVLFGCAHTLIPLVKGSGAAGAVELLFSGMIDYMIMSYAMYRVRLWARTLWLPVLIRAALDFLGVII